VPVASTLVSSTARSRTRCGTRSAATPPNSTQSTSPRLDAVATTDSCAGPPPSAITCHATATIHNPVPNSDAATDPINNR
jgi:hypothetical protein